MARIGSRGHTAGRSGPHKLTSTRPISAAAAPPHDGPRQIVVSATAEPVAAATVDLDTPLPSHPDLVRGRLENGFEYVIIPNRSPPNRFEAHLQVCATGCSATGLSCIAGYSGDAGLHDPRHDVFVHA